MYCLVSQITVSGQSQGVNRSDYRVDINETGEEIIIDGLLNETVWSQAQKASQFHMVLPIDTGYARAQTEVMVCYDLKNLYFGIICYDSLPGKRPVESLRRDWSFSVNDNFIVFIDTYNDYTNGFAFGVSAAGAQWDGIHGEGGFIMLDWDTKWNSAVQSYQDRWVAEFSIPFRSIRYREGVSEWGISYSRLDLKTNEKSSWTPIPRQFPTANLAFTGTLAWDKPLSKSGTRFSLIPYATGKITQNKEAGEDIKTYASAGFDAKVILSSSLNLDLTVNPDFSQVEVDEQQTNLDRFELFYPEKRQFFLENSDIFANLGSSEIRPFFSRRIGLNNPVIGGARLSGKLGEKWRTGIMDMQTGMKDSLSADNFAVAVLQRQLFSRSNVTGFLVNKQATMVPGDSVDKGSLYNRVLGLEYNMASTDNRWTGKFYFHKSFNAHSSGKNGVIAGNLKYSTESFMISLEQNYVGEDFLAEVGYIRRTGIYQTKSSAGYKFYPSSSKIANHGPLFDMELFTDTDFSLTDREVQIGYLVSWLNTSSFSIDMESGYLKLSRPFDPTNTGGVELPAGDDFNWFEMALKYNSDSRSLFTYAASARYGGFFNGTRLSIAAQASYRVQPFGSLAVTGSFNRVELPSPFNSADLILVGPKLDLTFTDKIFLTTFVQYNNQIENINTNIRFQWRFAPVSDLYIVYTDNTLPENYTSKNRGLVLKLSYWFN
jgi:hypothetical protein